MPSFVVQPRLISCRCTNNCLFYGWIQCRCSTEKGCTRSHCVTSRASPRLSATSASLRHCLLSRFRAFTQKIQNSADSAASLQHGWGHLLPAQSTSSANPCAPTLSPSYTSRYKPVCFLSRWRKLSIESSTTRNPTFCLLDGTWDLLRRFERRLIQPRHPQLTHQTRQRIPSSLSFFSLTIWSSSQFPSFVRQL